MTGFPVSMPPVIGSVDVSIVLPCLNEEESVGTCVAEGRKVLTAMNLDYEIIVVDNSSEDQSSWRARQAGARVIREERRGYGSACRAGIEAARGRYIVLGDADGTYDFAAVPRLIELLENGADLALGNRLAGEMEPGAMPWLHRHAGTPLISGLINLLFNAGVEDVNCGLRAVHRSAYWQMPITATGMEFASEMVVRAADANMVIRETPVDYRLRVGGEPKLRTWADGYRHLKLVVGSWRDGRKGVQFSPRSLRSTPVTERDVRRGEELYADSFRL